MANPQSIAQTFLDDFYKGAVSGDHRFALWTKHNRSHTWHSDIAAGLSKARYDIDTYFTMALFPKGVTKRKQENAAAIFGVWLDLDCGDKENGQHYFPTVEQAYEWVVDALAGKWSYIIHSGGGLHVYLMFDETFWIDSEEDRIRAKKMVKGFHRWANSQCPYTIDSLIDLSRVMRLPGSMHTTQKKMCHIMDECETEIAFSDLEELIPDVSVDETRQMAGTDGEVDVEDLKNRLKLMQDQDSTFDKTWRRARRLADKSPSGYCMSIANQMASGGFRDGEIIAALKLWRSGQTDASEKAEEWYLVTLSKAREIHKEDTVANTVAAAAQEDTEKGGKLDAISTVFKRKVTSIIKRITPEYKGNKEKCSYVINFEEGCLIVPNTDTLMSQPRMKVLAFEEANIMMAHLKANKWADFLALILAEIEEITEEIEGNLAFNLEQEIKSFIAKKRENCQIVENISEWTKDAIIEEDDRVYFPWSSFKMHLSSNGYYTSNRELARILKDLGCTSRQFSDAARTRMWCAPEDL